jgi:HD-like signal output (HDOD) protein
LLGIDHSVIGYELARKWELPPTIATAIAFHHHPSEALQHRRLSSLVHASDVLARTLDIGCGGDRRPVKIDESAKSITRHLSAVAEQKEEIVRQVESIVGAQHPEGAI